MTLCRACWLVENLDLAAQLTAAEFIWAPELDQLEINRAMPRLYTERTSRISKSRHAIDQLLETLKERQREATRELGFEPKVTLADILSHDGTSLTPAAEIAERLNNGFRLWPLDRWIERAGQHEYNAYQTMVAHWRRMIQTPEAGNYGASMITQDWLARLA